MHKKTILSLISYILLSSLLASCSIAELKTTLYNALNEEIDEEQPQKINLAEAETSEKAVTKKENAATNLVNNQPSAKAIETPHHHDEFKGTSAEVAKRWLKNGNIRYLKGFLRNDGQSKKDIQRLSGGQKPHSIVLSCSDSRVPPEIVFDQKLGEIFVVRNAGANLDSASIASIEYALQHLNVRHLLVMGHTQCGAVKAALQTMHGEPTESPFLENLTSDMHDNLQEFKSKKSFSADYQDEAMANVRGVIENLKLKSKIVKTKLNKGELIITSGLYHTASGKVDMN